MSRCDYRWELLDPNEQDKALLVQHWCGLALDHPEDHQCVCGAHPGDDGP
jgi:hypothetical protein